MPDRVIEALGRIPAGDFWAMLAAMVGVSEPLRFIQVQAEAALQADAESVSTFNEIPVFEFCNTLSCYNLTLGNCVEYGTYALGIVAFIHAVYVARKK